MEILQKMSIPRTSQGHSRLLEPTLLKRLYAFLLTRTVSEINVNFSRKSQISPIAMLFCPPLKGLPLKLSRAWGQKTTMMMLPDRLKDNIFSRYTNVTDIPTDKHRPTVKTVLMHSSYPDLNAVDIGYRRHTTLLNWN